MSKNMTRKGLAFGATIALGAGLISGVPAFAAGTQDDSVYLLPTVGAEYVVRSGDVFDLKANYDASLTASSRYLKFLVEDSAAKTKADIDNNGSSNDAALTQVLTTKKSLTDNVATITTAAAHGLKAGDTITLASLASPFDGTVTVASVPTTTTFTVAITNADVSEVADTDGTVDAAVTANGLNTRTAINGRELGSVNVVGGSFPISARDTDNSYVVTGIANSVANDQILRLISTDTASTVSVAVTAWVDNNGNGKIDPTEKASPTRTVSFLKASDISATTTIRPATAGETNVVADVVTTPVLNGLMILAAANENLTISTVTSAVAKVQFTRQGDATRVDSITNGAYSNTTKKWTFTSQDFDNGGWNETAATKVNPGSGDGTSSAPVVSSVKVVDELVTITTGNYASSAWTARSHGLRVGDKVTVNANGTPDWESTTAVTITSVPSTSKFTYKKTGADDLAETEQPNASNQTVYAVTTYLRDKVEAGLLTAAFHFDTTNGTDVSGSNVNQVGVRAEYSVGAKVVGSSGLSIAGTKTETVNAAGKVAKGATTADFVVTVKDADGEAVGAGVDVTMTAQRTAGTSTITANGLAVGSAAATTFYGKTDANGKVTISLTNSTGTVGDTVALTANSQGASQATLSAVWEDKIYTIHDLNDADYDNAVRTRSVLAGASYPITFLVQDQWKKVAGADVRIKVSMTDRTVQTSIVELTNGVGSLTVVDGGLTTGDTTITVVGQKKSSTTGLWADSDSSFADWDGASGIDLATVALKYQTASAINFNADAANFPSSTAADHTADVTTLTPVALDQRVSNSSAPAFKAAEKAVVSGSVTLANGVIAAGSMVTVASPGVAFKAGDVWALDTISFVTDGTFAVEAYSRSAGDKVVTVTSGAATKTQTVKFNAVASAKGYSVVLTTPASIQSGSTMKIEGQVLDANGNGIPVLTAGTGAAATLQVSYLGLGLVSGSLPATTDKDGKFYFYVLVGNNDKGSATVTASYDADGTGTDSAAVTVSKTIEVGATADVNAVIGSYLGRVAVRVENAQGSTVSVKIGGKWYKYTALTDNYLKSWKSRKGATVSVSVYVDAVLQNVETITVK